MCCIRVFVFYNLGWGSADFLGTRLLPLWFGARGSDFDWIYLQNSLDCNINLVSNITCAIVLVKQNVIEVKFLFMVHLLVNNKS